MKDKLIHSLSSLGTAIKQLTKGTKIIDRYIGSQIAVSTTFAVVVLSFVLVIGQIFKHLLQVLQNFDVGIFTIISFMLNSLPPSLILTIPWGFLTAILLVFGRLSADNELVSLRMAGMSTVRICLPPFVLTIIIAILCYWLNTSLAPKSAVKIREMFVELLQNDPMALFREGESSDSIPNHVVYIKEREENRLNDLFLVQTAEVEYGARNSKVKTVPKVFLIAKEAVVNNKIEEKSVEMELSKVHLIKTGPNYPDSMQQTMHGILAEKHTIPISLREIAGFKKKFRTETMTNSEINSYLKSKEILQGLTAEQINSLRFEKSQRNALTLAAFTFFLLGIPLGITAQRRETSVGFVISLVVSLTYFFFMIVAGWFKKDGSFVTYFLLWMPNIVFIGIGIFLFMKLSRK